MLSFGNYRVRAYQHIFSTGNKSRDDDVNGSGVCPTEPHEHMMIQFAPIGDGADMLLALDKNPKTMEWTIDQGVTFQVNAEAQAQHVADNLRSMFGEEIDVHATSLPPDSVHAARREKDDENDNYPGMYL